MRTHCSTLSRVKYLCLFLIMLLSLPGPHATALAQTEPPVPFPFGPIPLPPASTPSRWRIVQGYDTNFTHSNTNKYSFDFVPLDNQDKDDYEGAVGLEVTSGVAGTVEWNDRNNTNLLGIRLDGTTTDPSTGKILYHYVTYGHLTGPIYDKLTLDKRVEKGQVIGVIADEGSTEIGKHIHITTFAIPVDSYSTKGRIAEYCDNCPALRETTKGGAPTAISSWVPDNTQNQYKDWIVLASSQSSQAPTSAISIISPHPAAEIWAYEGESLSFDGSQSTDADGSIIAWEWDFGDGAQQTTTGPSATHTYAKAGTYFPTLKVRDNSNILSSPASKAVTIRSPQQTAGNVDIVIVLDCSGSMQSNDPAQLRKSAAKLLIQQARIGDKIGVVGFTDNAQTFAPLTVVTSQADKDVLQAAVDRAYASGGTSLSAGLNQAFSLLNSDASSISRRAVVFLTDGQGSYNNEAALYAAKGWRIYTVGLSASHDATLLRRIATETSGRYYSSPDSSDLQGIYADLSGSLTGRTSLFQEVFNLLKGNIKQLIKSIPGMPELNVTLYWPGNVAAASSPAAAQADVRLRLIRPDGSVVDSTDPLVQHQSTGTYESYSIPNPPPGDWTFEVELVDAASQLEFTLEAKTVDMSPPEGSVDSSSAYVAGNTVLLQLTAQDVNTAQDDLEYALSPDKSTWSEWLPYTTTHTWTFPNNESFQAVFVKFRDPAGNESDVSAANFLIDVEPPDTLILNETGIGARGIPFTVRWISNDAEVVGEAEMAHSFILEGVDQDWSPYRAGETEVTYDSLPVGNYRFLVRARDYAGNIDPTPAELLIQIKEPTSLSEMDEPMIPTNHMFLPLISQ